jgi:tetratricopeptide (TPR) repeat protein
MEHLLNNFKTVLIKYDLIFLFIMLNVFTMHDIAELIMICMIKGDALSKLNKSNESIKACDKAIEIDPRDSMGWYNRACFYSLINNKDQLILNLKKAIELNSSHKEEAKKGDSFKKFWIDKQFKKMLSKPKKQL